MKSLATVFGILVFSATLFAQDAVQVGYATMTPPPGSSLPVASSLFTYTKDGVLVSQAAVEAVRPILSGVVLADESGIQTGVALANPGNQAAQATLILRDAFGIEVARKSQPIGANQHISSFVAELFPGLPATFLGSLTFESNTPLAAIALRQSYNAYREPLYSSLPVLDANSTPSNQTLVFPHIAVGGGYTTQIALVNLTNQVLLGRCGLIASAGQPLTVDDGARSEFNYRIEPRGAFRVDLANTALAVGYAVIYPDPGSPAPSGNAIFQFKSGGSPVTEASVGAITPTNAARLFVDNAGTETGVAIANPGTSAADLVITLLDRYGNVEAQTNRTLPGGNHFALFATQLFPSAVYDGFTGLIEIRSSIPVAEIALKVTDNSRHQQVLTTLPIADLNRPLLTDPVVFPQIAIGDGFSMRLLFVNPSTAAGVAGTLRFRQSLGVAMTIPLMGQSGDQFDLQVLAGGGRQSYPGNADRVANISLLDPATNQPTSELTINEGNAVSPRVRILDSAGNRRDDYDAVVVSSNTAVARTDTSGKVIGLRAGFSSITVAAGGAVAAATATVVRVDSGGTGFGATGVGATGVAQDLSRRLYIASTTAHTLLLAQDFRQSPTVYAGIPSSPGYKNDRRLQALFQNPAYLALNQAEGSLYVSDSANHVIRRVLAGAAGNVVTLAGTGSPGSRDGATGLALFNNPQGIALDRRGNLWIADSGNHTIRLIDLFAGTVRTVAGLAGVAGASDGTGQQARFSSPAGIAIETESLARQLERERNGDPAPPVSVIVADTGNGRLRRVRESGEVETFSASLPGIGALVSGGVSAKATAAPAFPIQFASPVALTVDPAGNIYVSESGSGSVRVLLKNGDVVAAVQKDSLRDPRGIVATENGRFIVVDSGRSLQEIQYGGPQIATIAPNRVSKNGGEQVLVRGANFSPDTVVNVAGVPIAIQIIDTQTISFVAPPLPSGRNTLTIQNRGGIAQTPLVVGAIALKDLPPGYITTVAGGSTFSGEGAPALTIPVSAEAVEVDASGNVFLADTGNHRIRRIDSRTGIVTTVAGTGSAETYVDGQLATASGLNSPNALVFDSAGNLLIADFSVRKVDAVSGILTRVVGGKYGVCPDGPAIDACFDYITGLALDSEGNMYISDRYNERIRRVDGKTQIITTLAGSGVAGGAGDGGPASAAEMDSPWGLTIDNSRRLLYFADLNNRRIRRVNLDTGKIDTVAGGAPYTNGLGDNGPAINAYLDSPYDVKVDASGNLFISGSQRIRRVDIVTGVITTYAGQEFAGFAGDGGPATSAWLSSETRGIAVDAAGNVFITDTRNSRVRRVDSATGKISTVAGNGAPSEVFDNDAATAATLREPTGITKDLSGNLYITDTGNNRIRRVDAATGIITTVAGGGNPASGIGDGGLATQAILSDPRGRVAFDSLGNMFIADTSDSAVRRVDAVTGIITTVLGNAGVTPSRLVLDRNGTLYIADSQVRKIFKFVPSTGVLSTFAGGVASGNIGDDGPAVNAVFGEGLSLWLDAADNLIVTDTSNGRVRKIDTTTTIITTIAGGGETYFENQLAVGARIYPVDAVTDSAGNLFLIDFYDQGVRRVRASSGRIASLAGLGDVTPDLGDNGPALNASFHYPYSLYVDGAGNLFVADTDNQRVRVVRGPIP